MKRFSAQRLHNRPYNTSVKTMQLCLHYRKGIVAKCFTANQRKLGSIISANSSALFFKLMLKGMQAHMQGQKFEKHFMAYNNL